MSQAEKRNESRLSSGLRFTPVSCNLIAGNEKVELTVVNFHYRGACLRALPGDYRFQTKGSYILFKIGLKELPEKIIYRVVWETVAENGLFGIEFSTESSFVLARAERFISHNINAPVISSQDPLDPNRIIYLKVLNASTTGMLLSTSLSNKHLFPGMELRTAVLTIPNVGKTDLDLFIENSRPGDDRTVLFGVSIKGSSHNYNSLMAKYLSTLGGTEDPDQRLEKLAESNFVNHRLRTHLTIKEINTESDYQKVLKLRFLGYKTAGKVDKAKTWQDMGDGLEKEGIVLGAFLGGQLVASCEFRLNKVHGVRLSDKISLSQIPGVRSENLAEINKLVVHPKAQSSDIVLGIFQRIHALAILNGRPDGLIASEPKLIPLYERLGFKKTAYSFPHPVREEIQLTLMVIYHEAYSSADGMNPYAWSVAFSETQKFFDEIGINKTKTFSIPQQLRKIGTKAAIAIAGKKKKKKKATSGKVKATEELDTRNTSDPKWTKQHLNATVFLPYLLESQELIGVEETKKILFDFGFDNDYFKTVSNWISIEFFDEFITRFSQLGDPYTLNRRAGYRSVTREILGSNYFIVKHFFSPRIAFKAFEKFLPKFNKTRIYQIVSSGSNYSRIRISTPDRSHLPKHPSAKENWYAIAEAYVFALTGKPAKINPIKSSFDGDEYCEFIVSWTNPMFSFKSAIGIVTILAAIGFSGNWLSKLVGFEQFLVILKTVGIISAVGFFLVRSIIFKNKYREMMDSLAEYERHADDRYKELQNSKSILEKSYQEGKVIEFINKEIQTSDDLSQILQTALDYLCTKFEFKRSFVMIKDEEGRFLRTAAVFGAGNPLKDLWQFKVDISVKRDNPMVLSSVYRSGQSMLISNIDDHKFHLNEASRRLVEQLETTGFAMVPIPSENSNWGVLIADKGKSREIITRRDLVALQRISQSIGLALDKKAKIEAEVNVRKIFQKFVPSAVIESTLGNVGPKLGGHSREAICLFLDIRNFTSLSTQVPPEILCELLNQVFNIVHTNVTKSNGIIDKFLGDGALVTWGAVPGSNSTPISILLTAERILEDLQILNKNIHSKGLKPIEVGIGIHKGNVIAGNIGSQDRMEFTVIGNTVNIASRLEQLTKMFKSNIVISEELITFDQLDARWSIHKGIQVRGLDTLINVASFTFAKGDHDTNEKKETA